MLLVTQLRKMRTTVTVFNTPSMAALVTDQDGTVRDAVRLNDAGQQALTNAMSATCFGCKLSTGAVCFTHTRHVRVFYKNRCVPLCYPFSINGCCDSYLCPYHHVFKSKTSDFYVVPFMNFRSPGLGQGFYIGPHATKSLQDIRSIIWISNLSSPSAGVPKTSSGDVIGARDIPLPEYPLPNDPEYCDQPSVLAEPPAKRSRTEIPQNIRDVSNATTEHTELRNRDFVSDLRMRFAAIVDVLGDHPPTTPYELSFFNAYLRHGVYEEILRNIEYLNQHQSTADDTSSSQLCMLAQVALSELLLLSKGNKTRYPNAKRLATTLAKDPDSAPTSGASRTSETAGFV